jgi:hypothetical protein
VAKVLFGGSAHHLLLLIKETFAVVLSWAAIRIGCPKLQVSLSEVHNKTSEVNGLTHNSADSKRFVEQAWNK